MEKKNHEFLKKLLATFKVEAEEHVRAMSSGLLGLEKASAAEQQMEIIETVFREARSLKGAARAVNQVEIEALCQSLESAFSSLKRKDIVVILRAADKRVAFRVDEFLHEQEVLVKGLGKQLSRLRLVAGAAVLGRGRVVPVLNVPALIKSAVRVSAAGSAPVVTAKQSQKRKSILIAEDSITARTLLKNILESAGYLVKAAVGGVDAFTTLRTEEFDIMVSDVDMPRMSGFDLTAKIRADKKLARLPVVLVTALESREDRERGIDVGASAYIVKSSFDQSDMLEVIRRLI